MDKENLVHELKKRIVDNINVESIIMFGSVAQNKDSSDSDIDILVIWNEEGNLSNRERRIKLRRIIGYFDCPLDVLTYTQKEVDMALSEDKSFISQVIREGKVIYGRLH